MTWSDRLWSSLKNQPQRNSFTLQEHLENSYRTISIFLVAIMRSGLKGEEIPLAARICAVVDVWYALSSDRSYCNAWAQTKVIDYLLDDSGKHFDPNAMDIFLKLLREGKI